MNNDEIEKSLAALNNSPWRGKSKPHFYLKGKHWWCRWGGYLVMDVSILGAWRDMQKLRKLNTFIKDLSIMNSYY